MSRIEWGDRVMNSNVYWGELSKTEKVLNYTFAITFPLFMFCMISLVVLTGMTLYFPTLDVNAGYFLIPLSLIGVVSTFLSLASKAKLDNIWNNYHEVSHDISRWGKSSRYITRLGEMKGFINFIKEGYDQDYDYISINYWNFGSNIHSLNIAFKKHIVSKHISKHFADPRFTVVRFSIDVDGMNTNDNIIADMRESGISDEFLEELETLVVLKEID